jgi:hypothetical protein
MNLKLTDITVSQTILASAEKVFDVWIDPKSPGEPWFGAEGENCLTEPAVTRSGRRPTIPETKGILLSFVIVTLTTALALGGEPYKPAIDPANFQPMVDNPYFPLVPGTTLKYQETVDGEDLEDEVTVMPDTKMVMGVKCVVVHDVVRGKGTVKEDTYDWYAQDKEGTAWYFGEDTKQFKAGGAVDTKGSWEGGANGRPGIIMPAHQTPGKPYRQEYSANNAEDMAQVVASNGSVTVPAGDFKDCVKTKEWSMLESGNEYKWYAKGIGVVQAKTSKGELETLVSIKGP